MEGMVSGNKLLLMSSVGRVSIIGRKLGVEMMGRWDSNHGASMAPWKQGTVFGYGHGERWEWDRDSEREMAADRWERADEMRAEIEAMNGEEMA